MPMATRVEKKTLSQLVAEKMRQEILQNTLPSGNHITVQNIAERYGTSPLPVREAFRILEGENLIETMSYKGAVVCPINKLFFENIYDIMTALECLSIDAAIRDWNDDLKNELIFANNRILLLETDEAIKQYYTEYNLAFHNLIEVHYHNRQSDELLSHYRNLVSLVTAQRSRGLERARQAVNEHTRLIEALDSRDINEAREAFFEHAYNSRNATLQVFFQQEV